METRQGSIVPQEFKDALRASDTRDGVYLLICDNEMLLLNEALSFADYVNPLTPSEKAQNYKLTQPVKNTISADEVRAFTEFESSLPVGTECKTMILHRCDLIYRRGSDILLKTIEEPSTHSLIILTATDPAGISDVIRSRCMTFTRLGTTLEGNYASFINIRSAIESASDVSQVAMGASSIYSMGVEDTIKAFTANLRDYKQEQEMRILRQAYALARTGSSQQAAFYIARGYHALAHWPKAFGI